MARQKRVIVWKGEERVFLEVCKEHDRSPLLVRTRVAQGWELEKALTTPSKFGDSFGKWSNYEKSVEEIRRRNEKLKRKIQELGYE